MPNHLLSETSPYLLRHANNPVDWFPWGQVAFEKALREEKPIFLSIGYSANHRCHVMEKESFDDPEIVEILNREFISIMVDREERPDLDGVYTTAVIAMTGQGDYPLNVFLTGDKQPFYGGTYFPPNSRFRTPSFRTVLTAVSHAWKENRLQISQSAEKITEFLKATLGKPSSSRSTQAFDFQKIVEKLDQAYDWQCGGWGNTQKFPNPMTVELLLLLDAHEFPQARTMAVRALKSMQRGGFHDLVGGGFHRYSTDAVWRIPHFEKLLSDNAQLAQIYLHAFLVTGLPDFKKTCEKTLDFILREMAQPDGGFYSSLDADSEGEEGRFYIWDIREFDTIFEEASLRDWFFTLHKVNPSGNFDEKNVLSLAEIQANFSPALTQQLEETYAFLLKMRNLRSHPAKEEKIITSWNALTMRALADAGRYLRRADYLSAAQRNAAFILDRLCANQQLNRTWYNGTSRLAAQLEDYAALILGLVSLYQADFNLHWLDAALDLTSKMLADFSDGAGGFVDTPASQSDMPCRPADWQDKAIPSGNALAANALLILSAFYEKPDWLDMALRLIDGTKASAAQFPLGFSHWLQNIYLAQETIEQIAILYPLGDLTYLDFINSVNQMYSPARILASSSYPPKNNAPALLHQCLLVENKPIFYRFRNFSCQQQLTTLNEANSLIKIK